jgi:hypothetical protein
MRVAGRATAIFWRTGIAAGRAARIARLGRGLNLGLDFDRVVPVVADIVGIAKRVTGLRDVASDDRKTR